MRGGEGPLGALGGGLRPWGPAGGKVRRMGFMRTGTDRPTVEVVAIGTGKVSGPWSGPKGRIWLLGDRTMVLVRPDPTTPGGVIRDCFDVESSIDDRRGKRLVVITTPPAHLSGGAEARWEVSTAGCGCGMGAVGAVGPIDGPYHTVRVRTPDWHAVAG